MEKQTFRPTSREINDITDDARRGARRGSVVGGLAGAAAGSFLKKKKRAATLVGALAGATAGTIIGRKVGRVEGAKAVRQSRAALLQGFAEADQRLTQLEAVRDSAGNFFPGASGQHPDRIYPKARGPLVPGIGIDDQGRYILSARRQKLAEKFGWAIINALDDSELSEEVCASLRDEVLARMARVNGPHASSGVDIGFARQFFSSKIGQNAVAAMSDAEIRAHYLGAQRRGLLELEDESSSIEFGDRLRNQDGEFTGGPSLEPGAARRAYAPDRNTGKTQTVGALGAAAGLAAAIIAHKKLKNSRLPRIKNGLATPRLSAGSTVGMGTQFVRRTMPMLGPVFSKRIRRPRRKAKTNFHFLIHDPTARPFITKSTPRAKRIRILKRLLAITEFGSGGLAAGIADGIVDAVGLNGAVPRKKKKKPLVLDENGVPLDPQPADPPAISSFSVASQIGSIGRKYGPEAGVIAGADLTAEMIHDSLVRTREKRKKRLRASGIESTSGLQGAPQTMAALHATITEFSDDSRTHARKRAEELGAASAGAVSGAVVGLRHDQGTPTHHSDLRPGDRVYRRFGPGGLFQHAGVVGKDGNIVHRTSGSSTYRAIKPESFRKIGKAPTFRENRSSDLPRRKAASNASAAAGSRAGKYSVGSNNCEHGVERLVSRGRPTSGQLRRALGGAGAGALVAGSAAALLARHRKDQVR